MTDWPWHILTPVLVVGALFLGVLTTAALAGGRVPLIHVIDMIDEEIEACGDPTVGDPVVRTAARIRVGALSRLRRRLLQSTDPEGET